MIKLYFHNTPNPLKVALMLEETGLSHSLVPVDTFRGEQHAPAFRALNPNGKLPVIEDSDGTVVFDSNAILLYLAEKTGQFLGDADERGALLSWLMFVASGLGPFSGQSAHFLHVHGDSAYATNRYRREAERHYAILDARLADRRFIATRECSIVDLAAWAWIDRAGFVLGGEAPLEAFPHLARWFAQIDARPAVARLRAVVANMTFKTDFDEETLRALFPQNFAPAAG